MLILLLKILGLSFAITKFEPLSWLLDAIRFNFSEKRTSVHLMFNIIATITTCFSCCSMWVGFILGGFWIGILSYFISFVYLKKFSSWEYKITNPI